MPMPRRARSGGPRTVQGKCAVAFNALSTGAYAATSVLPGECADEYHALLASLQKDFAPRNAVEALLVSDLANLLWKKRRLDAASHRALLGVLNQPLSETELHEALSMAPGTAPAAAALYARQSLDMSEADAHLWAQRLEAVRSNPPSAQDGASDLNQMQSELEAEARVWLWQHRQAVAAALEHARAMRTLAAMEQPGVARAADSLNRALFRTLAELRKLKDWHLSVQTTLIPDGESG